MDPTDALGQDPIATPEGVAMTAAILDELIARRTVRAAARPRRRLAWVRAASGRTPHPDPACPRWASAASRVRATPPPTAAALSSGITGRRWTREIPRTRRWPIAGEGSAAQSEVRTRPGQEDSGHNALILPGLNRCHTAAGRPQSHRTPRHLWLPAGRRGWCL